MTPVTEAKLMGGHLEGILMEINHEPWLANHLPLESSKARWPFKTTSEILPNTYYFQLKTELPAFQENNQVRNF
jgi:hypothetical protein